MADDEAQIAKAVVDVANEYLLIELPLRWRDAPLTRKGRARIVGQAKMFARTRDGRKLRVSCTVTERIPNQLRMEVYDAYQKAVALKKEMEAKKELQDDDRDSTADPPCPRPA